MTGVTTPFTNLVTSEHSDKPNYMAMVQATCQPSADLLALYNSVSNLYDIDLAIGNQLDVIGQIVGVSRTIQTDLAGVYFSLDLIGLGLNEAPWKQATDPDTNSVSLTDPFFRLLLKARILSNQWDGSIPDAYVLSDEIYSAYGYRFVIKDELNLSMMIGLVCDFNSFLQQVVDGSSNILTGYSPALAAQTNVVISAGVPGVPAPELIALLANGYLDVKPATVRVEAYFWPSAPGRMFAFDMDNTWFSGLDDGLFPGVKFTSSPLPLMRFGFDLMTLNCAGFDVGSF